MKDNNLKVLALKYRPNSFNELIGQDIMVQTITNSIKLDKLPNAYLLTGIRGVGKTTTARLIAKALNCDKNFLKESNCDCRHCEEISNSKHLDVLEMDAASRTGIDDIRELIESSKYNPVSAKYKIFIIDEVHMLSKQAFNGLLKTLEEPPPHLKFIFATTEVKKIPITIISRCQRFDLHRVPIKILLENLKKISKIESIKISNSGLNLIAKASEGSVRDSLSLLNRAQVSQHLVDKEIDEIFVRKMLGIADRSKILELLKFIFEGDQKKSIEQLRKMFDEGLEPVNFLNDFLEIIHFVLQRKNLGNLETDLSISENELNLIDEISNEIDVTTLILFWQFSIRGLDELAIVSNQLLSLEMLIIRLLHLKETPSYEDLISKGTFNHKSISSTIEKSSKDSTMNEDGKTEISKNQIKTTTQTKPEFTPLKPKNISDINIESIKSFVNLIKFEEGKIDIAFNENLGKNFVRNLSEKLLKWTKKRWQISLSQKPGQKTFLETKLINRKKLLENEKKGEVYKKFKDLFSDGELVEVSEKD